MENGHFAENEEIITGKKRLKKHSASMTTFNCVNLNHSDTRTVESEFRVKGTYIPFGQRSESVYSTVN